MPVIWFLKRAFKIIHFRFLLLVLSSDSFRFSLHTIMVSANNENFELCFILFILFSSLIAQVMTSLQC